MRPGKAAMVAHEVSQAQPRFHFGGDRLTIDCHFYGFHCAKASLTARLTAVAWI